MAVDFCDYFWGEDHNGWNVLYQNMKQGLNASKELGEFFKDRWSIDEAYCKSLVKLANKANLSTEKGTLSPIFTLLKASSEKMSSIHSHMVNRIQDLVKDIIKYNEELHKRHKLVKDEESQTEDIMKTIQVTSGLAQKAKENYTQRCQDLEKARREGTSPKDVEKAESKLRKAHDEYKTLVDKYNAVRDEFERRMIHSCRTYIYVLQTDQNAMGQILQELMNKYSEFTIDRLLDSFALSKLTGLEKPGISGQSPEPPDQSKSSADDATSLGGVDKGTSGGVLTGGKVKAQKDGKGVAKSSGTKKESQSTHSVGHSSLFSLSKVNRRSKGINNDLDSARPYSNALVCHDGSRVPPMDVSQLRPVTYRRPKAEKPSHRTTSLLNIFVASANIMGNTREGSAPPKLKTKDPSERKDRDCDWSTNLNGRSLPASPSKVASVSLSPSDVHIPRSLFRSSKSTVEGSGQILPFGFLRSRREKKKEKKAKKKKADDASSNKDEKSDNENSEAKTEDLLAIGTSLELKEETEVSLPTEVDLVDGTGRNDESRALGPRLSKSSINSRQDIEVEEPKVDEDGYSIRPPLNRSRMNIDNSFDSSSDSDSADIGIDKRIHVEIKPISNGTPPTSASVDELRATIEGMDFSPMIFTTMKKSSLESQDSFGMRRSDSLTAQVGPGPTEGVNWTYSGRGASAFRYGLLTGRESTLDSANSNGSRKPSFTHNHLRSASTHSSISNHNSHCTHSSPRSIDRYSEMSEILGDGVCTDSASNVTPPRRSSSRGSTPVPTMAIPRPTSSRKSSGSRGIPSPASITALSRAESASSLEFRTSGIPTGISRGPSPLTIGMSDTIPLAVAFQELCHAYFKGTDESRIQVKITGEMMVSFPAGIVGVLTNNPSPAQLCFKVQNYSHMLNPLPNRQLITLTENESSEDWGVYRFDMASLSSLLRKQAEQNPTASYFNVDIIKYQVNHNDGAQAAPLHMVSYWRCEDDHTDLRVDFSYNGKAMSQPLPILNISVSVPVDGVVKNMQSKPAGQWLPDQQKAVWNITDLSQHSVDAGKGSLRAKFEVAAGPTTPTTVSTQFNCEGTTLSGVEFTLAGPGYRVSLIKKRYVSGKYICDGDAVLRHRYGSLPS